MCHHRTVRVSLYAYGKRLIEKIGEDDVNGAAAEMAYRFFLALFPFFIFLAALSGFVASTFNIEDPSTEIMELLGDSLPEDASSVLEEQLRTVTERRNAGLLSIGILGAIWATSGGISALTGADPAKPNGGAAFHDSAIWVRPA